MKEFRIGLYHCPQSTSYKLIKLSKDVDENDPCLLWVFDASRKKLAKKILNNMNIANVQNAQLMFS